MTTRAYFVVEGLRFVVTEDGVKRHWIDLAVRALGINQPHEGFGVSQLADHDRTGAHLQDDDTAPRQALREGAPGS